MFKKGLYAGLGRAFLIGVFVSALVAPAQAEEFKYEGAVMGVGIGLSTGQTDWNHTAPGNGDPTSELTYDDTDVFSLELYGRLPLPKKFFIRGNVGFGIGEIGDGNLREIGRAHV